MAVDHAARDLGSGGEGHGRTNGSQDRLLRYIALGMVLLVFFAFFQTRIWDIDFWWHIASGRWIVENRSLPDTDPFSVYVASGPRAETLLKGYWLAQIALYQAVRVFGLDGIIVLKALLLSLALLFLVLRLRLARLSLAATFLLAALAGTALLPYTGERPQLFSFLFASLVFLLYEQYRSRKHLLWLFAIPPVMLVWANLHGAAVLGAVLLAVRIVLSWAEPPADRSAVRRERMWEAAAMAAIFLMTVLTPSGTNTYAALFQLEGSELQRRTSEYLSPFRKWARHLPYVALMLLSAAGAVRAARRRAYGELAVTAILAYLSASASRYVPFFVLVAGPWIAAGVDRPKTADRVPSRVLFSTVMAIAFFSLVLGWYHGRILQRGIMPERFPEAAVGLINNAGLRGKVFNHLDWGGYLLWQAFPAVRTVIDGRILDPDALVPYTHILWATPEGIGMFESGGFDLVLLPPQNPMTGELYPFHAYLRSRPDWRILSSDRVGTLYARETPSR